MNQKPIPSRLRFLVEAERGRPGAPGDAKALAQAKLAALLGPGAGLGGGGGEGSGGPGGSGATGTAPSHGSFPTSALKAGASGLGTAKLIGAFVIGGIVGGAVATATVRPGERLVYVDPVGPALSASGTVPPTAASIAAIDVSSLPSASASAQSGRASPPVTTPPASSAVRSRDGDLSAERTIIERARSALARGDGEAALVAVAQHEREFAKGQLAEEREVVAVQALVTAGRVQEAAERGARFRKAFPNSLLLPIVDQALR